MVQEVSSFIEIKCRVLAPERRFNVEACAARFGYKAATRLFELDTELEIRRDARFEIGICAHAVGEQFHGILAVVAIYRDASGLETPLTGEAFVFSYAESLEDVQRRFLEWLDVALAEGLDLWRKSLA